MILASHPHYAAHLAPVARLLPDLPDVAVVAGYPDVRAAYRQGFRRIVLMQHGAGQSYGNDHPHYPGGRGNEAVGLFLVPNEHAAERWRARYPHARVEVVGCPRLDALPAREPGPPTVAVTFHWDAWVAPETRSAFAWFREALPGLARSFRVIGHGHPRRSDLAAAYARMGIEWVPDFDEVCRRADLLVFDNTSAGFEFAATGRPVVVLNAPWYRRDADLGLRFWEAASVGLQVDRPELLAETVRCSLMPSHEAELRRRREAALRHVYAYRSGAAQRAADAILRWV